MVSPDRNDLRLNHQLHPSLTWSGWHRIMSPGDREGFKERQVKKHSGEVQIHHGYRTTTKNTNFSPEGGIYELAVKHPVTGWKVVYIGKSSDLKTRTFTYCRSGSHIGGAIDDYIERGCEIYVRHCVTPDFAAMERHALKSFNYELNIKNQKHGGIDGLPDMFTTYDKDQLPPFGMPVGSIPRSALVPAHIEIECGQKRNDTWSELFPTNMARTSCIEIRNDMRRLGHPCNQLPIFCPLPLPPTPHIFCPAPPPFLAPWHTCHNGGTITVRRISGPCSSSSLRSEIDDMLLDFGKMGF